MTSQIARLRESPPMSRKHTILLIEDNPEDAEVTLRNFRKNNILNELVVVHDGVEALDYLLGTGTRAGQEPQAVPEVILLDLKLPKIDGLALLRRLQSEERTRDIPVVVLTSNSDEKSVLSSYDLGARSFLRKPFSFAQFMMAAKQLRLGWMVLNEPPPE
jgi:two-component system, response regulator